MKTSELATKTGLKAINESEDKIIEGVYISDMASDIITNAKANALLITLLTHKVLIAAANLIDVAAIVILKGRLPDQEVIELANRVGIALFSSEDDAWTFAAKLARLGFNN
ncbi:MAG TPA: DRTGG domain-containing protein [Syntrophobacteraceae bacterium]|nr:DRTGG domain-containing protein [Syntrophobacteraceae bacterium]